MVKRSWKDIKQTAQFRASNAIPGKGVERPPPGEALSLSRERAGVALVIAL